MARSLKKIKPFIKKLIACVGKNISIISAVCSILSFCGYTVKEHILFLILGIFFLITAIAIIIFTVKGTKTLNIDYSKLMKIFTRLPSLVDDIVKRDGNGVRAKGLYYSYRNNENNELEITISIARIKECNDIFCIGLLNDIEDDKIKIIVNKNSLTPSSKKRKNKYTLYTFNLPNPKEITDFDISITLQSKSSEESTNLFFCPKNYVREVDVIRISVPGKHYKLIELEANSYRDPVDVSYEGISQVLDTTDNIKLNSIFWFDRYN